MTTAHKPAKIVVVRHTGGEKMRDQPITDHT
jgi:hypothetical protein